MQEDNPFNHPVEETVDTNTFYGNEIKEVNKGRPPGKPCPPGHYIGKGHYKGDKCNCDGDQVTPSVTLNHWKYPMFIGTLILLGVYLYYKFKKK